LVFNNPTLPENTGDHPVSYTTLRDTIRAGVNWIFKVGLQPFCNFEQER
jgi:hypothetical protein